MTDASHSRIASLIADAAQTINSPPTMEERVNAIVSVAADTIPGFDEASLSVTFGSGPVSTRAASSLTVRQLDEVQYAAGEGPCFQAMHEPGVVMVPYVRAEQRWPVYIRQAIAAGVTSQMGLHLGGTRRVRGALNLYGLGAEGIDPEALDLASLFATHVAAALGWAHLEENLNMALGTRKTIGAAVGIVMERYQISEAMAFAFLTRISSSGEIKLRDVAQELVTQTDTHYSVKDH